MSALTREDIIRNEKASEIDFNAKANAEDYKAETAIVKAAEYRGCAKVARDKYEELERNQ